MRTIFVRRSLSSLLRLLCLRLLRLLAIDVLVTTASLPGGAPNTAYDQTLAAVGGAGSYTWSITAGVLPAGLSLNASTGQSFTTRQMFPEHVLTGTYDMNGASAILPKDLGLFVEAAARDGAPRYLAEASMRVVEAFARAHPQADQSEIYPFIRDRETPS